MYFQAIDKITIIGRSGCGKSYLGRIIQKAFPRVIIFDSLHEYPKSPDDIQSWEQFTSFIRQAPELGKFRRVVRFTIDETHKEEKFNQMIRLLYELGDVTIVVEEIQNFTTPHNMPEYMMFAMTSGRHRRLSFIFTTQRPGLLHKTILSQSTHVFSGNLIDLNDIRAVASFLGKKGHELAEIPDRSFFWFSVARKIKVIKISTENSKVKSKP